MEAIKELFFLWKTDSDLLKGLIKQNKQRIVQVQDEVIFTFLTYLPINVLIGRFFYAIITRILNTLKELPIFGVMERRIYRLSVY